MILKNQDLPLPRGSRQLDRRVIEQPLQGLRRLPFRGSRDDPFRIPSQYLFGADRVIAVQSVLCTHVDGPDRADDVVKQCAVAVAVPAAESQYSCRRSAFGFSCRSSLNCRLKLAVRSVRFRIVSGEITCEEYGSSDLVESREHREHSKHRQAGVSKNVAEIRAAFSAVENQIRVEPDQNFRILGNDRMELLSPLINIARALFISSAADRHDIFGRSHRIHVLIHGPVVRRDTMCRTRNGHGISAGVGCSPRIFFAADAKTRLTAD